MKPIHLPLATPVALALLSAFATPAAFADVELGPVTLYSRLQTALEIVSVTGPTPQTAGNGDQTRLDDQGSYLGFKRKFDLGNGAFALAQIESRFFLGNNGNNTDDKAEIGTRNTFVGVGSDTAGTLRLGRNDNAYKLTGRMMSSVLSSPLNAATIEFNNKQIMARLGSRQGDLVGYESPALGNFKLQASYNLGKDASNSISGGNANNTALNTVATTLMPQLSLGVGFASGPLTLGAGYTNIKNASWKLDASSTARAVNNKTGDQQLSSYMVGGQYTFGNFALGTVWERVSSSLTGVGAFDQTQDNLALLGGYKSGPWTAHVRYAVAQDVANAAIKETGGSQTGVAVQYEVNKNLSLVGSLTNVSNKANATYTSFADFPLAKGNSMNMLALGVVVNF
jgi:predicted porin